MPPEIRHDTLSTSYYGQDVYIEARQLDEGGAYVHVIAIGNLPEFERPDCGSHPTLDAALRAGLHFATDVIDS